MHGIQAFAHTAELQMDETADIRAPGGAITMSLCGSHEHPPPCPLSAHYTDVRRDGETVAVRVLFACRLADVERVRGLIDEALRGGVGTDLHGAASHWRVLRHGPAELLPAERDHADRLIASTAPA